MTMIIRSIHPPVEVKVDNASSAAVNLTAAQAQQTGLIINTSTNINLTTPANNNTDDDNNEINHIIDGEIHQDEEVDADDDDDDNDDEVSPIERRIRKSRRES